MSRIIANNIRHNDATADSLSLDSSGNVSAPGNLTTSGNLSVTGTSTLTGNVNVDSGTLFVDTSANRVGVGTATPAANLEVQASTVPTVHIRNTTTSSFSSLNLAEVGDSNGTFVINRLGSTSTATGGARAGQVWNSANAPIVFGTNGTEEMRLLSGGGLTFNGDTAAANALDDYEEGTWTPTTYSNNLSIGSASYVKVGRMVTVHCYLTGVSSWTAAGTNPFWIFSFPFSPDGGSGYSAVGSATLHGIATSQSGTLSAVMDSTNGRCRIQNNPTNGSFDTIDLNEMGATTWTCTVSITYRTTT